MTHRLVTCSSLVLDVLGVDTTANANQPCAPFGVSSAWSRINNGHNRGAIKARPRSGKSDARFPALSAVKPAKETAFGLHIDSGLEVGGREGFFCRMLRNGYFISRFDAIDNCCTEE